VESAEELDAKFDMGCIAFVVVIEIVKGHGEATVGAR
jgi:hypothetical protein